jgi:hypothetical protein
VGQDLTKPKKEITMNNPSIDDGAANRDDRSETRLTLNERLALIGLIDEGMRLGSSDSPIVADLFGDLWELMDATVSGSKIDRLKPEEGGNGFRILEVNSETGENLGRLNMIYLNKPIPCFYLVYVEVAAPYRNKGLGNRILKQFRDFLITKSALGILDNIIPQDDPTYDIYRKLDWQPVEEITGVSDNEGVYMVFVPPSLSGKDLASSVSRLLHHIKRKRSIIDMRDNEMMVRRTIDEFKELYNALLAYFERDLRTGQPDALMRFMFTRFVTKLLGFSHRISRLLGYTGGESLEQIVLDSQVRALRVQSYAPRNLAAKTSFSSGDRELWLLLPEALKKRPARIIEALPNYRRPKLVSWMEETGVSSSDMLTIGDLMDLGFDPTRLKEITINGEDFIFERVQARQLPELQRKKGVLDRISAEIGGARVKHAALKTNPPLLVIRDRGNGYVLRRKIHGIHWEEAVEQLQTLPSLKALNASVKVDRIIKATVKKLQNKLQADVNLGEDLETASLAYYVSWDLDGNRPRVTVDMSGTFLESVWVA